MSFSLYAFPRHKQELLNSQSRSSSSKRRLTFPSQNNDPPPSVNSLYRGDTVNAEDKVDVSLNEAFRLTRMCIIIFLFTFKMKSVIIMTF